MEEDLSAPYDGYDSYRLLDAAALAPEISEMRALMDQVWPTLEIPQDLGFGMMLWLAHFFPDEPWAKAQREKSLAALDGMWIDPPGYFCRARGAGGEASHGTSEFYALPARITRDLIERKGFSFVAAEADWPDAARIDAWVRDRPGGDPRAWQAFARFPTWISQTELASHYFETVLSRQFDEYIWFDTSRTVTPLRAVDLGGVPDTYPFGV